MTIHKGRGVFPGIAFGKIHFLQKNDAIVENTPTSDPQREINSFLTAKAEADRQLEELFESTKAELGEESAMIIDVQRMMLEDEDFCGAIKSMIHDEGCSAAYAVSQTGQQFSATFAAMDDAYMKERATDVLDMSERLVDCLLGRRQNFNLTHPSVVVAEDLTPSETLQLDKAYVRAFVIQKGAANSHTAILARMLNIPCIVQADITLNIEIGGKEMAVDGEAGLCYIQPNDATMAVLLERQATEHARRELFEKMRGLSTVTKSGKKIRLYSNIGSPDDLPSVLENNAEGIGLFRSEFLYLGRNNYPTEDELFEAYRKVVQGMSGRQVVIRTLDIGADKQVDYFNLDTEENPALGLRGVRICIDRPELFRTQLRAIYRASAFGNVAIMFPMVISLWEVIRCKETAQAVCEELADEGIAFGKVELGIMIETPASVIIADSLAKEVDFFSVGTNDLTQYTLAIDRQNSKLEQFYDAHHPAIIAMLASIAKAAKNNGIWAGICGELAADLSLTETLVDMGYDELSVSPTFTLEMRKRIRELE